jgi:membrane protease YdiL (CAAX protease family)
MVYVSWVAVAVTVIVLLASLLNTFVQTEKDVYGDSTIKEGYVYSVLTLFIGLYFVGTGEISRSIFLWILALSLFALYNAILAEGNRGDYDIGFNIIDVIFAFALWFALDFRWISREHKVGFNIDWAVLSIVTGLYIVGLFRKVRLIKTGQWFGRDNVLKCDLQPALLSVAALVLIILPVGYALGLVSLHGISASDIAKFQGRLIVSFLTVAFVEEVIFRGTLQCYFTEKFGYSKIWVSIILTSIIFGVCHLYKNVGQFGYPNWRYAIVATLAGSVYGYLYSKTGNLLYPMTIHALTDATWVTFLRPL